MPVDDRTILAIRDECLADDVDILPGMCVWSEDEIFAYFESGGSMRPPDNELLLRQINRKWQALGALGQQAVMMPGEARGAERECYDPRPEARVRLFVLYGVADVSMSTSAWIKGAPPWCEVRLVDYPGHGFRFKEPLPTCSEGGVPLDERELQSQRAALVDRLTQEIVAAANGAPFALYGFSFGALIAYHICVGLQASRDSPTPICLCVAGRGAPHCAAFSRATCELLSGADDEGMLEWQSGGGQFKTSTIPAAMRPRAARLFRCGMLLGASPAAEGSLDHALPDAGEPSSFVVQDVHLEGAPRLAPSCRLAAVGSAADGTWHGDLVARWADVAAGEDLFRGMTLADVEHLSLMNHRETMRVCFEEVGRALLSGVM